MRRRLLSLCLALCMVLGMLPAAATAAEPVKLTVSAGEAGYEASYVGTGGETAFGKSGSVYAVQIPGVTDITIGRDAAGSGEYTAANISGGQLVSFQE